MDNNSIADVIGACVEVNSCSKLMGEMVGDKVGKQEAYNWSRKGSLMELAARTQGVLVKQSQSSSGT